MQQARGADICGIHHALHKQLSQQRSETADYLNKLNLDNVLLHIDTHSMAVEDVDFSAAVRYAGKRLGYVHLR